MTTSVQQLLFQPATLQGDRTAIRAKDGILSYRELNDHSAALAERIRRELSVRAATTFRNICIGVCMDRGAALLPAVLAVFRLGAVYLPLDPELPCHRRQYMAADAGVQLLLTDLPQRTAEFPGIPVLPVSLQPRPAIAAYDYIAASPEDIAYIIYTSGTTGNPKGVRITYANLSAFTENVVHGQIPHPYGNYLAFASISFDASILEWMLCLPIGGTLILARNEERRDAALLASLLRREKINAAFLPPSLLAVLPELDFPDLHLLLFGAEAISEKLFGRLKQQSYQLMNLYGPTENTVVSTWRLVSTETSYDNIGFPLKGTIAHVLGEQDGPVGDGKTGELCLGGDQVSPGYIGHEELNRTAFVHWQGKRLYRTGDLVQQLPDGSFRFIGRKDTQIKLRGFRIELTEISRQLEQDPEVEKAYVKVLTCHDRQWLGAWLQPADPARFPLQKVKERLSRKLPAYMIPNRWQIVENFTRTFNDKTDTTALSDFPDQTEKYESPVHPGEIVLCQILEEILQLPGVSVEAAFTDGLGMTSLDILNFAACAAQRGCPVDVSSIYAAGNVRQLLRRPAQQPIRWYREQRPGKPVIVLVCGAAYFNHLYFPFAERLYKKYDLLIIDAIYDHFLQVAANTSGLLDYYARTVSSLTRGRSLYAFTGFCMGTELAIRLAALLFNTAATRPLIVALDGQAWLDPGFYSKYPDLILPGDTTEMIRKRNNIIQLYFRTVPNFIYRGKVIVFLSGKFHQQAGLMPGQAWTPENYRIFREEYDRCEQLWHLYYPEAPVHRLPADHWGFFEGEALEQLITFFLK